MKTYFISSDIHGYYTKFMDALINQGFQEDNPEHLLIICGDAFDRGREPEKLLSFFVKMIDANRLIFIGGNHEDLLMDLIQRQYPYEYDFSNGAVRTIKDLTSIGFDDDAKYMLLRERLAKKGFFKLMDSRLDYYEKGKYIFVHGWIPVETDDYGEYLYVPNWRNASRKYWEQARWLNGIKMANKGILEPGKTIVCGHFHASYGNVRKKFPNLTEHNYSKLEFSDDNELFKPYVSDGIIDLDACTAFSGLVNIMKLREDEF